MIHYTSEVTYQRDSKFVTIGINSILRMKLLMQAGGHSFFYKSSSGYVFDDNDMEEAKDGDNLLPVMIVKLRDSGIHNWKQAHGLRIRKHYADESVAKSWYDAYVEHIGPIVSDTEHLEGGYLLWKHFLKSPFEHKRIVKAWDLQTKKCIIENLSLDLNLESSLWSKYPNVGRKNIVLSLEHVDQKSDPQKSPMEIQPLNIEHIDLKSWLFKAKNTLSGTSFETRFQTLLKQQDHLVEEFKKTWNDYLSSDEKVLSKPDNCPKS